MTTRNRTGITKAFLARLKPTERPKSTRESKDTAGRRCSGPSTGPPATATPTQTLAVHTRATAAATATLSPHSSATSSNPDTTKTALKAAPPDVGTKGRRPSWSRTPIQTPSSTAGPATTSPPPAASLRTTRRAEWSVRSPTTAVARTQSFTAAAAQIGGYTAGRPAYSSPPRSSKKRTKVRNDLKNGPRNRAPLEVTYWTGEVCDDDVNDIRRRIWEFEKQPVVDNWPRAPRIRVDKIVACTMRKTNRSPLFQKLYPRW